MEDLYLTFLILLSDPKPPKKAYLEGPYPFCLPANFTSNAILAWKDTVVLHTCWVRITIACPSG
jgi:hypothetical protein